MIAKYFFDGWFDCRSVLTITNVLRTKRRKRRRRRRRRIAFNTRAVDNASRSHPPSLPSAAG
jgi:hypothetical protein